jgi:hypothetical protein
MLELFAQHKSLRAMYYAGLGIGYMLAAAALLRAIAAFQ